MSRARAKETTSTAGTGATLTLDGAADNHQSLVAGVGDGNTDYFVIVEQDGSGWEEVRATVHDNAPSADTLEIVEVLDNSNGDTSRINLSGNGAVVFCTLPGGKDHGRQALGLGDAAIKDVTGLDANVVTGTAGTSGNLIQWNADGDAVDASIAVSDVSNLVTNITVTQPVDLDAIETRVNELDASVILMGTWDASTGSFPGGGSAQAGESWIVSTGGTVDGVEFVANDRIVAITDNASTSTYTSNWHKLDYTDAVLSVAGKTGAVTLAAGDIASGTFANARISQSSVTQHEAALSIAFSQITGAVDADTLAGLSRSVNNVAATVVNRDGAGDIKARLFRPEYTGLNTGGNINYFWTSRAVGTGDNYLRPTTIAAVRSELLDGELRSVEVFTSSGTWSKPSGLKRAVVEVVGAGGGGGGSEATGANQRSGGGGGGGGGSTIKLIEAGSLGSSETVTLGAGGAGSAGSAGGNGGTSSFGSHCSATGGNGGDIRAAGNPVAGNVNGGAGGAGSSGDINYQGGAGSDGVMGNAASFTLSGTGGASKYGPGGTHQINNNGSQPGNNGGNFGGGGGGASAGESQSARPGGDGADGRVIVWEYF